MKVIFLDVDGVLNSVKDRFSFTIETDYHFILLKKIVDATNAEIVLSSSWRIGDSETVRKRLKDFGMDFIDVTPQLPYPSKRGDEIRSWLKCHTEIVESFVILDDESDMCEFVETNLVKTDMKVGLQKSDVNKAIKILNKKEV